MAKQKPKKKSRYYPIVERVARSEEELGLLTALVEQPTDDLAKLVYADWLEERNDPRGDLLRRFVRACRDRAVLPSLKDVPEAWVDLTGLTISSKIVEAGLTDHFNALMALTRPALRLDASRIEFEPSPPTPPELGVTRLGGDPDVPANDDYPTGTDGQPLHFICQFNLEDLQGTIAAKAFPSRGLLSIFRHNGFYPEAADLPRLVRLIPPGTPLHRVSNPSPEEAYPSPFRADLRLVETLRLPAEFRQWPGVDLSYEQASSLDEIFPTNLGGEAFILLGHATHGNIGEEPLKDRPDWIQLMLIPFWEGPDFGVSDMSTSYHLPAEDLKAGRFDRLEVTYG